jgi:putative N6-adenine-specific DNA methylase
MNFEELKAPEENGVILMNPPYGERIKISETDDLYSMIGSTLKHNFPGYRAWVISSDRELLKKIGLRTSFRATLYNGPIECTFVRYDLYPGTNKGKSHKILTYEP